MALRSLLRRPGFTALAILVFGVGAGATAAVLAAVYGVLLKPLPYREPDRLAAVWPGRFQSNADLLYLREHGSMFSGVAAVAPGWTMSLTGWGDPAKVTVARVSGNLFELFGVRPRFGRVFREGDARSGADRVAILTHAFWVRQFAGDPGIIGRTIRLEAEPFEVVGVMRPDFEVFGLKTDAFTPFALDQSAWYHQLSFSMFAARVAAGRSLEQADRDYRALIPRIRRDRKYPDEYGRTAHLQDLRSAVVGDIRSSLLVVGAAAMLILLIGGANVGTLLLTRAAGRSREIAVRAAMGASRGRIARELVAEGTIVALAGGAAGALAARIAMPALVTMLPRDTPRTGEIAVGSPVAAAVLAAATLVGLVFALAPALTATRVRMASLLRAGAGGETKQGKRVRGLLVAGEIALALVLAVGAGLLLQSLWRMQRVDPGFNPDRLLTLHLQPTNVGSKGGIPSALFYRTVFERLTSLPGVASVGGIQHLPFSGYSWNAALDIEGHPVPEGGSRPTSGLRIVTPDYFRTIGQRVAAGREFVYADAARNDRVIVNETLAKTYYNGAPSALNRRLRIRGGGIESPWMTIIGVVGDVRHSSLTEPVRPEIYTSISNTSIPAMMVAVRASADPLSLVPAVRDVVWSIDKNTPISDVQTMGAKIGASLARPRLLVILLGGFAAIGVLLALVGVYGVVAYSVAQRRREIGIMVALGAGRSRVVRHVLGEGVRYASAGLAVGVPAALAGSTLLGTLLYGVRATDPRTYVSLAALIAAVVLAASYVPARRAARVDPIEALKYE